MSGLSDKFYEELAKEAESMTPEEARERMIRAGIIDADGHLAARYKPDPDEQTLAPVVAAAQD